MKNCCYSPPISTVSLVSAPIFYFLRKLQIILTISLHFLFHNTVLQYTQPRIHRPKIRNNIFMYVLSFFAGFGSETIIPNTKPCGSATLIFLLLISLRIPPGSGSTVLVFGINSSNSGIFKYSKNCKSFL